jgi:hypothetical protein
MPRRIPAAAYTWLFVVSEIAVLGWSMRYSSGRSGTSSAEYICTVGCQQGGIFVMIDLLVLGPLAFALLRRLGRPFDRPPSRLDLTSAYIVGVGYLVLFRFVAYSVIAHIPLSSGCFYG